MTKEALGLTTEPRTLTSGRGGVFLNALGATRDLVAERLPRPVNFSSYAKLSHREYRVSIRYFQCVVASNEGRA
jgi:hypothetical protein